MKAIQKFAGLISPTPNSVGAIPKVRKKVKPLLKPPEAP